MATVTSLARVEGGFGNPGAKPYMVDVTIDFAAAATAKGSALAAADVIEALTFGGPSVILAAGIEVDTVASGGTGTVLDLGVTGGDVDAFVDGFAFDSASAGDYAALAGNGGQYIADGDTLDVLIQAATTVSTAGVIRVWAIAMPVATGFAGKAAAEVDRDTLA